MGYSAILFHLYRNLGDYLSFSLPSFLREICYNSCKNIIRRRSQEVPLDHSRIVVDAVPDKLPWLVLPHKERSGSLNFFDLARNKVHRLDLPGMMRGGACVGSSKGLTCPLQTLQKPPSPCFLISIGMGGRILIWLSVDSGTSIGVSFSVKKHDILFRDILFRDGTLYALNFDKLTVEHFNFRMARGEVMIKAIPDWSGWRLDFEPRVEWVHDLKILRRLLHGTCLVESINSELLLIAQIYDTYATESDDSFEEIESPYFTYKKTSAFRIFRMDPDSGRLDEMHDLSDQVIFLAHGGSASVPAKDLACGVQGNCIFFADNQLYSSQLHLPLVARESGTYYIDSGRIERTIPSFNLQLESRLSWFTPDS
ncbi:F-BOX PROTEIN SKIP23-LIKE [Salix viminalis]|uniref:F-BOX PROTEIN SKIP23-LIKE n=1 Tax=Salix viminalis TaxID=40686 RepID=A0A9Q0QAL6_SALVM|nr:F-BOX PROTEIN SKIP23-LIKE [Salix viminalis]